MRIIVIGSLSALLAIGALRSQAQTLSSADVLACSDAYQGVMNPALDLSFYDREHADYYGGLVRTMGDASTLVFGSNGSRDRLCAPARLAQVQALATKLKVRRQALEAERDRKRIAEIQDAVDQALATQEP